MSITQKTVLENKGKTRIRIHTKLFLGFSMLFAVLAISIGITLYEVSNVNQFSQKLTTEDIPNNELIVKLISEFNSQEAFFKGLLLEQNQRTAQEYQDQVKSVSNLIASVDELYVDKKTKQAKKWKAIKSKMETLFENQSTLVKNKEELSQRIQSGALTKENEAYREIHDMLISNASDENGDSGFLQNNFNQLQKEGQIVTNNIQTLNITQWILLLLGLGSVFSIGFFTSRSITRPLFQAMNVAKRISEGERNVPIEVTSTDETADLLKTLDVMQISIAKTEVKLKENEEHIQGLLTTMQRRVLEYKDLIEQVSAGDLTKRLTIGSNDELSQLGNYLNTMTSSLSGIASQIMEANQIMSSSIEEMENVSTAQVSSATQQAASVHETTSIIEEIKATSAQTLEKAGSLGKSAELTRQEGERGLKAIEETIKSMTLIREKVEAIAASILALSEQTQQIGKTTDAVSALAEQSKLLALNASIEAAKAGDAGKGFAVVANEVKELAEQSQQATEQVQKILQDIQRATDRAVMTTEEGNKGVNEGIKLVEQTEKVVHSLSEVIQETAMASQQIVAAVRQESAGIDQIAEAINEINKVTGQFVSSTEQTKSTTKQLAIIAKQLQATTSKYKLSSNE